MQKLIQGAHPVVSSGLAHGDLKLHGRVYKIETGEVFGYDPESGQFKLLGEQRSESSMAETKKSRGNI